MAIEWHCNRCGHKWKGQLYGLSIDKLPRVCPSCKSPYWNSKRKLEYDWQEAHGKKKKRKKVMRV